MLPTGHLAAGYLTTQLAVARLLEIYPQAGQPRFWWVAISAAVLVDLDDLFAFFKIGKAIAATKEVDHRKFLTHAPLLHLGIAALAFGLAWTLNSGDWQLYAILYLIGTWTHFVFDSFGYGIMWLWPFSGKLYSIFNANKRLDVPNNLPFLKYWIKFLKEYLHYPPFILEMGLIILALFVYLR